MFSLLDHAALSLSSGYLLGFGHLKPYALLFPYKDEAQVENSLILTGLYCFESTEFTDDNSRRERCFCYFLFLTLRSWDCCSDYQSVVPDTSFIIIQWGKIRAKKFILLIIHMFSKSDGSNLCPFIQYSIFKQIQKLPRHLTVWNILCQIVMASLCQ